MEQVFYVNDLSPFILQNVNPDDTPTTLQTEAGLGVTECPQDYLVVGGVRFVAWRVRYYSVSETFTEVQVRISPGR